MCAKRCGLQRSGSGNGHGARGRGDGGKRGTTRTWQQRQQADHNGDQATAQQRWGATARRGPGIDEAGGHDAGHDVAMVVVVVVVAAAAAAAAMVVSTMCEGGAKVHATSPRRLDGCNEGLCVTT